MTPKQINALRQKILDWKHENNISSEKYLMVIEHVDKIFFRK